MNDGSIDREVAPCLKNAIFEIFELDEATIITPETNLAEAFDGDSLDIWEIMHCVERALEIRIPQKQEDDFLNLAVVGDLEQAFENYLAYLD